MRFVTIVLGVVLSCLAASGAFAQTKRALLIGVNDYRNVDRLQKAVGDVTAMKAALEKIGFNVDLVTNLDRLALNIALSNFAAKLQKGDVALVQFSGHGVAIDGENYLLPADIPKPGTGDKELLKAESLPLSSMLDRVRAPGPGTAIFIIDACRENPFANAGTRSVGTRGGLANVEIGNGKGGVFIMYSAGYGQVAVDRLSETDPEPTSVYTRTLLRKISVEGKSIVDVAREVREDVEALAASINHQQRPAYYDELSGPPFYFVPPGTVEASAAARPATTPTVASLTPTSTVTTMPMLTQPSFDCRYARAADELAVCNSPDLAALDRKMSQLYYATVENLKDDARLSFRKAQGVWLGQRQTCGGDPDCVGRAYRTRIAALEVPGGQVMPAMPVVAASPGFNCRYAKRADELTICGDGVLSAKDRQLNALFGEVTKRVGAIGKPQLDAGQRAWLQRRGQCQSSVACIAAVYERRILELSSVLGQ